MKNVGVPETPLASALATSSATRGVCCVMVKVVAEALEVEAELRGVAREVLRAERALVGEQRVVVLPEPALRRGGL